MTSVLKVGHATSHRAHQIGGDSTQQSIYSLAPMRRRTSLTTSSTNRLGMNSGIENGGRSDPRVERE
jgi:hypothetical protein